MQIKIKNNLINDKTPKTFSSVALTKGDGTIGVRNANGFTAQWAVQFGETGNENTEIKLLNSSTPSGTQLVLSGTIISDHPTDTPIYAIKYDKLIIKRSTTGTAGTATAIANGTISITPDSEYTMYDDTSGASDYAYKAAYYSTDLNVSSSDSGWIVPAGYSFYSLHSLRDRVKNKLFDSKYIRNDELIDQWINEWLEKMTTEAIDVNQDYLLGTADISHGTDGLGTITQSDFVNLRRVWFTTNGTNFYKAERRKYNDFYPSEQFNETAPYYYLLGDNVVGKLPASQAGTVRISYYKRPSILDDETDELPVSMRSHTKSFVDYALSQAYFMDKEEKLGETFLTVALREMDKFVSQITPRSHTGATYIKLAEPIEREDQFFEIF